MPREKSAKLLRRMPKANRLDLMKKRFSFKSPTLSEYNLKALPLIEVVPEDGLLISWSLWYLKKEVIGIGSPYTAEAKIQDLQKFINYFYYHNPNGFIKSWDKPLTYGFIEKLGDIYEVASVRRIMATLSHFVRFLERYHIVEYDDSPVRGVKLPTAQPSPPKQLVAVSGDNDVVLEGKAVFEKLLEVAEGMIVEKKNKKQQPYRDIAIIATLYHGGLRVTEICNLTMAQMEKEKSGGIIFRSVKCKGNKYRDVYIKDDGSRALNEYIKNERGSDPGPLFMSYDKKRLSRFGIWRLIKNIAHRSEMNTDKILKIEAHPHRFRHVHAHNLKEAGFSESELMDELGHSSMRYVGVYTKPSEQERFKRLKKVG